jgi:multidrug transporter EmrE-like cation transporter
MYYWFLLALSLLFEVVADYFFKSWSLPNSRISNLIFGIVLYGLSATAFAFWVKGEGTLVRGISIFTISNCIAGCLIGTLLFHEPFPLQMKIGVFTGLIAIVLLAG